MPLRRGSIGGDDIDATDPSMRPEGAACPTARLPETLPHLRTVSMRCSKCGAENPGRAKFCVECASPFARRCPSCNAENPPNAKFCLECAKPLDGTSGKSQGAAAASTPIHVG